MFSPLPHLFWAGLLALSLAPAFGMAPLGEIYARTGFISLDEEMVLANGLKLGWFPARSSQVELSGDAVVLYFPDSADKYVDLGVEVLYNYPAFRPVLSLDEPPMYFVPSLLGRFTLKEEGVVPQLYLGLGLRFNIGQNGSTFSRLIFGKPLADLSAGVAGLNYGLEFGISIYLDRP